MDKVSGKRVAISQSNYIPWKGYFDLIHSVDEFILFDDVQYTRRDWRNRNIIKTPQGLQWLTIPVDVKNKYHQLIKETVVASSEWREAHWKAILFNYSRSKYFRDFRDVFETIYLKEDERYLSRINHRFIRAVCDILGIQTKISWSMDYEVIEGRCERLLSLCQQVGAAEYLSGPAAKDYMQEDIFSDAGIKVTYMDYSGYPEYRQLSAPFAHEVSVLDLIFNEGPEATKYMKSFALGKDR